MALKFLAFATLAAAHKPIFDYTLAANCPICRQYGNSTIKEIYSTPGVQEGVHFQIHMGIRKGHDGQYECVLEEPGCPMTRYFLCAQHVANSTGTDIMRFMNCFNENPIVEPEDKGALVSRTHQCSTLANIEVPKVESCNTELGDQLLAEAESYFVNRFPEFSKPGPGPYGVPHVFINGVQVGPHGYARLSNYSNTMKLLCDAGLHSDVCGHEVMV